MTRTRLARPGDEAELRRLLGLMLRHYGEKAMPGAEDAALRLMTAPPGSGPVTLVAELPDCLAGLAVLNRLFPADNLSQALFMKELFVEEAARGHGVGRALLAAACRYALDEGFSRIDWTTERANRAAAAAYRALGVARVGKNFYRLRREDMQRLARGAPGL